MIIRSGDTKTRSLYKRVLEIAATALGLLLYLGGLCFFAMISYGIVWECVDNFRSVTSEIAKHFWTLPMMVLFIVLTVAMAWKLPQILHELWKESSHTISARQYRDPEHIAYIAMEHVRSALAGYVDSAPFRMTQSQRVVVKESLNRINHLLANAISLEALRRDL